MVQRILLSDRVEKKEAASWRRIWRVDSIEQWDSWLPQHYFLGFKDFVV